MGIRLDQLKEECTWCVFNSVNGVVRSFCSISNLVEECNEAYGLKASEVPGYISKEDIFEYLNKTGDFEIEDIKYFKDLWEVSRFEFEEAGYKDVHNDFWEKELDKIFLGDKDE